MGKKYLIVEEESSGAAGCLAIAALLAVLYFVLSYAHILLSGALGFCGFLLARHIIDSNPIYKNSHKIGIYLAILVLLGGFGYWGGKEISDHFRKSIDTPPEEGKTEQSIPSREHRSTDPVERATPQAEPSTDKKIGKESGDAITPAAPTPAAEPGIPHDENIQAPLINPDRQPQPVNTITSP